MLKVHLTNRWQVLEIKNYKISEKKLNFDVEIIPQSNFDLEFGKPIDTVKPIKRKLFE